MNNMAKTRVVVVDDSALVRSMLTEIINRQPTWNASARPADPLVAREMIRNLNPDVITLDVEMPRMDGIDFLSQADAPAPDAGGDGVHADRARRRRHAAALELGAMDFVAKPKIGVADGLRQLADDITDKIRTAAKRARAPAARQRRAKRAPARRAAPPCPCRPTGGQHGPPVDREDHLHRRLHRRHRSHQGSADGPAGRRAGGDDHAAHAARLHQELRHAAGQPVPHPRGRGASDGERILPGHAYIAPVACT
jgi:two-component system chemotaxis response regulator CheB